MIGPVSPPRTIGKLINETGALFALLFSPLAFLSMSSRASPPVNSDNDFNGLRNAMELEFPRPLFSRRRCEAYPRRRLPKTRHRDTAASLDQLRHTPSKSDTPHLIAFNSDTLPSVNQLMRLMMEITEYAEWFKLAHNQIHGAPGIVIE
ncbi:hypothetical protein B0H16DRAFT_1764280 [Mycena metata]|uniref:Uncharacterized protein n=1 Tax=Mycena metata TaxID=1033252 RepID=A0AAD7MXA9_9AGAR|nr:hypothetical protein B0H16DRAFT_1764280 [Mycena metata]